ncbi:uncharacterized protein TNCV_4895221 [Trichonephila clavipes]|nr:uncharacterized protein TNCV_4895221 [Trichonephila clavipes]
MQVVLDPCSCLRVYLVYGRVEEPPHDCAIHVLLESMVFREQMLYGEPTEARLEEILQIGKEYLPRVMHMTDQNSASWQRMYNYVKSGFPQHYGNSSQNRELDSFQHSAKSCVWFKILFTNQHYPLAAMVGKDGKIYFRPVDVGAFIGRSSVYKFTKRFDLPNLPNFGVHVPRSLSFGKTVIVFTSHLNLTWDKGVNLKFFRVGLPRLAEFEKPSSLKIRMPTLWVSRTARDWRTWQASAHQTLHCHDSQREQQSQSDGHHGESYRAHLQAQRFAIHQPRK